MKSFIINKRIGFIPKVGDRIHLKNLGGHYEIVEIQKQGVIINCGVWERRNQSPQFIEWKEIKCKYKGYTMV